MSEDPEIPPEGAAPPPRKRRRRWLKRLAFALVLIALLAGILISFALTRLEVITEWSIERIFPGVTAEIEVLRLVSATELDAQSFVLKSRETDAIILSLQGGLVRFNLNNLRSLRLDEIRLIDPILQVSPGLFTALSVGRPQTAPSPSTESQPKNPFTNPWTIGEIEIENGQFIWLPSDATDGAALRVEISGRLQNFGMTGPAATELHEVVLKNIRLNRPAPDDSQWVHIPETTIRFTTGNLFGAKQIDEIVVPKGEAEYDKSLLPVFITEQGEGSGKTPDWSVKRIEIDHLSVTAKDLPSPVETAKFSVSATLDQFDLADRDTRHSIAFSGINVGPDSEDPLIKFTTDKIDVAFAAGELLDLIIREIRFTNPVIRVALRSEDPAPPQVPKHTKPNPPPALPEFRIEQITAPFASLILTSHRDQIPNAKAQFSIDWQNVGTTPAARAAPHSITFWDVNIATPTIENGEIAALDIGEIQFTLEEILEKQQIRLVDVRGGRLLIGEALEKLIATKSADPADPVKPAEPADSSSRGWSIADLRLNGIRTRLHDAKHDVSDITLTLGTTLKNVQAAGVGDEFLDDVQEVEFANIELMSPVRPSVKILSFRSVFVRFTLKELAAQQLREIVVLSPTIYLNQDLFIYMDRTTTKSPGDAAPEPLPPWNVKRVEVKFGSLVIGGGTAKDVGLPLGFETLIEDVALDNLAELKVQASLDVPRQSYNFPSYQIEVDDVEGDLRFAYPPEKGENNLVQKLDIRSIRWRQFESEEAWIAVTFDKQGINGQFGGNAYSGYVNGGFSFFFQTDSPWIGWVSGEAVDTKSLTAIMAPQNFVLTGPLDFRIQLDAFSKNIDRVIGSFSITEPGDMRIGKLDEFIAMIPDDWNPLKSSITTLGLETLRDFAYDDASGKFWFVKSQGVFDLSLLGDYGSRKFNVLVHNNEVSNAYWVTGPPKTP